ncbi:MAG: branched-chain amino acid aminotransferase [Victivallaceae bacterium]
MNMQWDKLGFEFLPVKTNVRAIFDNGAWGEPKLYETYDVTMSVASNCLHYGQAIFEGMKAFTHKDGDVFIFRPDENFHRMNQSAARLMMPEIPQELFMKMLQMVIRDNIEYVPPFGSGGSLYVRPVMYGTSSQIGVASSLRYELVIMVVPVGAYYKNGIKPVDSMVALDYDRAAPQGTGKIKCAGNYAASLYPSKICKQNHCQVPLFFDPKNHEYIDEFGTSNFFAISKDNKYITPESSSILPSITNKSLMQLAKDLGYEVEQRPVHKSELANLKEVGACGTAVVITPVGRIFCGDTVYTYDTEAIGPVMKKLYDEMTGIQYGKIADRHNWLVKIL